MTRTSRSAFSARASRALRALLGPALAKMTDTRHAASDALVVAGVPRSGSTWLAELVQRSVPRAAVCFEPLHLGHVPAAREAGYLLDTYVAPGAPWPEGEPFMRRVLEGRVVGTWTASHAPIASYWRPDVWVVKFVRANLMLEWIARTFDVAPPALLLRHPCSTILSQVQRGWGLEHPPHYPRLFERYPRMAAYVQRLETPVQFLAAQWCVHHWVPLSLPRPYPFHLMTYEGLITDGADAFPRLLGAWGREPPADLEALLHRPSMTTAKGAAVRRGGDLLGAWRDRLPARDVEAVLAVVRTFGLDVYGRDPEPDAERLWGDPTPGEDWR